MKIIISGASGMVGSALTRALRGNGHTVLHLVREGAHRHPAENDGEIEWEPNSAKVDVAAFEGSDAVVNLNGASIAHGRWTDARKRVLRSSRVDTTRVLVDSLARLSRKPRVFVSASAIGYYGNRGDELLIESSAYGTDFLGLLARDWEGEASRAQSGAGIRTVITRFGVILSSEGGALERIAAPFRYGVGGRLGSGKQWMSWVSLDDAVGAIRFAIDDASLRGPVNVVSPHPVRNAEFTKILAGVLHRLAIVPAPAFALRLALGEMANALLLASQRVQPAIFSAAKYNFKDSDLASTLKTLLRE